MTGFPKKARLLTKADYSKVFNKSVKVSDAFFLILIHINSKENSKLGLIVSKKVDKRAVQRNRIKRLVRESFRNHSFQTACDFVVMARGKISEKKNAEIFNSLESLWIKAESRIQQIRKQ